MEKSKNYFIKSDRVIDHRITLFRSAIFFSILLGSCFVFGVGKASAATYYVSPTGSNTSPYDTWEKAANLPSTAVTAGNTDIGGDGPHTVYIAPGIYSDQLVLSDTDWANGNIIGTAAHDGTANAGKGQVVITNTARVASIEKDNITFKNLSLTGTNSSADLLVLVANSFFGDNLYLYDSGRRLIYAAGTGWLLNDSLFAGCDDHAVQLFSASAGEIRRSLFRNSNIRHLSGPAKSAIYNGSSGALVVNNSDFSGSSAATIAQVGTGSTTVNNSVVEAGITSASIYAMAGLSGTMTSNNNMIIGNFVTRNGKGGTIGGSGDIVTDIPRYHRASRSGMFSISVDDWVSYDYALLVENTLAARGKKGSFAMYGKSVAANLESLNALQARGTLDIINHSYSHSVLTLTGNAFSITKADKMINIDRTADIITVSDTVTVTGFKTKTLYAIRSELSAAGITLGSLATGLEGNTLGEALADSSGAQVSPYTAQLLIDPTGATGFYKVEMGDSETALQAITGYTSKIFCPRGSGISADGIAAVQALSFDGLRGDSSNDSSGYDMSSMNVYRTRVTHTASDLIGATVADTIANTKIMGQAIAQNGLFVNFAVHGEDNVDVSHIEAILDTLITYFPEITITDVSTAIATIKAAPWSTTDNITYTRTWTDQSDYHLQSDSPAIDAGTDVSLTTDFEGNPVYGPPDIGGYEFQPTHNMAAATPDDPQIGETIRVYGNGKFRNTVDDSEENETDTAKLYGSCLSLIHI